MPEASFDIKIRADLDGKGLKEVKQDFQQLHGEINVSNDALKKTADQHESTGNKAQDAGKKIKRAGEEGALSHRELREVVRETGDAFGAQIPMIGLWMNRTTAAIGVVLGMIELVKQGYEAAQSPVDQLNAAILAVDAANLKAAADAATAVAASIGAAIDKERDLDAEYERGTAAIDARIRKYNAEKDAILAVHKAQEEAYEALVNQQVAAGTITEEEGRRRKDIAKQGIEHEVNQAQIAKEQFELEQRRKDLRQAQANTTGANSPDQQAIDAAIEAAKKPSADAEAANAAVKEFEEAPFHTEFADMEHPFGNFTIKELRKKLQETKEERERNAAGDKDQEVEETDKIMQESLEKSIAAWEQKQAGLKTTADQADVAKTHADAAVTRAKQKQEEDLKRGSEEAEDKLAELEERLERDKATLAQIEAAHRQATQSNENAAEIHGDEEAFGQAEALARKLERGEGLTNTQNSRLIALMHRLHDLLWSGQITDENLRHQITDLERKVNMLEQNQRRTANTRG